MNKRTNITIAAGLVLLTLFLGPVCWAGSEHSEADAELSAEAPVVKGDLAIGLTALAAAMSVSVCALATGIAQSRIGAAGCGALAEKPETSATVILLIAIPETMVILGFVTAIVLLFAV